MFGRRRCVVMCYSPNGLGPATICGEPDDDGKMMLMDMRFFNYLSNVYLSGWNK